MTHRPSETTVQSSGEAAQSMRRDDAQSRQAAPVVHTEVRIKGQALSVPSVEIGGRTVITTGSWLKIATVHDEELVEGDTVADPESFISRMKERGLNADIFSFPRSSPIPLRSIRTTWNGTIPP